MNPFKDTLGAIRAEILTCLPCEAMPIRIALMAILSGSAEPIRASVVAAMSTHESAYPLGAALELMNMGIHQLHTGLDNQDKPRYTLGLAGDVLAGDYLSTGAFRLLVKCNDIRVMKIVADAVQESCEAEVLLIEPESSVSGSALTGVLAEVRQRAAPLGKAAGMAGGVLAGYNGALERIAEEFGRHMTTAHALLEQGRVEASAETASAFLGLASSELNEAISAAKEIDRRTSNGRPLSLCSVLKAQIARAISA